MGETRKSVKPSPRPAKVKPSLVWAVMGSLVQAFLLGWLILSGLFITHWWQAGYFEAASGASAWLNNQAEQFEAIFEDEDAAIKTALLGMHACVRDFFSGARLHWMGEEAHKTADVGQAWTSGSTEQNQARTNAFSGALQTILQAIREAVFLIATAGAVMLLKLVVLLLAIPLFLLASLVGLSDGLMLRAIRTASLGRESAYLFHKLVELFPRVIGVGVLVFLVMPVTTHAPYVLLLLALGVGVWFSEMSSRFKKYV